MTGTVAATKRQLVIFETGGEKFAADIFAVERVLRHTPPRLLPNSAPWLRGVIEHGGAAIPVVDLRERLGLAVVEATEHSRILVIVAGDTKVGVTVDTVHAVRTVEASAIEPPPAIYRGLAKEYLEGVVRDRGDLLVLLATAHLLTSTEKLEMQRAMKKGGKDG